MRASLALALSAPAAAGEGRVVGVVTDEGAGVLLEAVQVSFLDALNAVLVAQVFTDGNGAYDGGLLPAGSYKVHFAKALYASEFHGAGGTNVFVMGASVLVPADSTVTVNESLLFTGPVKVVLTDLELAGTVTQAGSGVPLSGIHVSLRDANSGFELLSATTGSDGTYFMSAKAVP